jgi:GPH family glycoside/pentoside/hexuronide:cation symporter
MTPPTSDKSALHAYEPVSLGETISYGLGDVGFNMYWAPLSAFMMVYLSDVAGLSLASIATLLVTMRLVSAVADPVFGAIADRTHTVYGRYRPWFLWLSLPLAAAGILFFSLASAPHDSKLFAAYVSLILLNLIYTAANTAYNALSGVITPDSSQRELIMSLRFGGAFLSAVLITWATPKLVTFAGRGNEALGWQFVMTIYGVVVVGILINLFLHTRERFALTSQPNPNPLLDVRDLFMNRPWVILFVLAGVVMIASMLHTSVMPFFMKAYAGRPDLVISIVMTFTLGLAAGSAISSLLTRLMSRQRWISIMLMVAGLGCLGFYFCQPGQIVLMFILQAVSGVAFGTIATLTFAMYADTADYNAWKTGHRATAMTYSMIMLSKKVGAAIAAAIIGWALVDYASNKAPTPFVLDNIRLLTGLAPAIMAFAGVGIIALYDLSPERVIKLQAQLLGGIRGKPQENPNPLP